MKAGIHPTYKDSKVICACGEEFTVQSINDEIHVEVCSKCHPFYTGKQGGKKHAGKVDEFNKKYGYSMDNNEETA